MAPSREIRKDLRVKATGGRYDLMIEADGYLRRLIADAWRRASIPSAIRPWADRRSADQPFPRGETRPRRRAPLYRRGGPSRWRQRAPMSSRTGPSSATVSTT